MTRARPVLTLAAAALALASLTACDKKEGGMYGSTAAGSASAAASMTPAHPADPVPATTGAGPSDGSTAIGGLSGDKNAGGGAATGGKPAPTAGDGSASAPK